MQATFSLTKDDYVHAGRAMLHRKPGMRAFYMFMGLCGLLVVGSNFTARGGPPPFRLALQLAGTVGVAALIWYAPALNARSTLKNHTQAFGPRTWTFAPTGVSVQAAASSGSFDWSAVLRATEDHRFIYFFISDAMAHILPKRAFAPGELAQLRQHLRQWLGSRAELA